MTGIKPAPVRWMLSLGGIDPDKEQGIRELQQTAAHGDLLKPFAKLLLAVAALRDKNNAQGCGLLHELAVAYPRNPLYRNNAPECRSQYDWLASNRELISATGAPSPQHDIANHRLPARLNGRELPCSPPGIESRGFDCFTVWPC